MPVGDFDQYYGDHPWANLDKKTIMYYDPDLLRMYRSRTAYAPLARFVQNLGDRRAKTMVITHLYDIHPDFDPIGLRQIWMPAAHIDSGQVTVTFNRYGGKVAYHEYDDIITYWRQNRVRGIRAIINGQLGIHMTDVLDMLVRNAFLSGSFKTYAGNASDFGSISTSDTFVSGVVDDVHLGMSFRGVPYAQNPTGVGGAIVCITSPGVIYDIQQQAGDEWIGVMKYANPGKLLRYEVGTYRNVRFVQTPKAVLYNAGAIIKQVSVTSPITAGDGAASTVDDVIEPGQAGATNYVQCSAFSSSDFAVNDMVSLHVDRTSTHGVTNGVDFTDGKLHNLRVVEVDATNNRLRFDRPIMLDFTTDLTGGGVYAYITKARHIHTSLFVGGPDGIVTGVGRPPRLHTPGPVDDFGQIHRFTWDAYLGYQVYRPHVFEVHFSAGSFRYKGDRVVQ